MKIGFIGLGTLGREIAKRLKDSGFELLVWNRTIDKAIELGFDAVKSPRELADLVDVIFVIVFDSKASKEIIFGKEGLLGGSIKGKTIVDMTTNEVDYVIETGRGLKYVGVTYLDAPILGSVIPAREGKLTLLVGGDKEKFNELYPVFQKFAKTIIHVGDIGNATKLKLVNNVVLGGFMEVLAEAVAFGEKVGINRELVLEVLANGAGKSMILDVKREKLIKEDFETHFSVDLIYKDLYYAEKLAYENKGILPAIGLIKELYALCKKEGWGNLDFSAVYKLFR
ncbi:MAG: NAD(P)-dependent oxidoreductase [Thermosulfidibacteraceae bacterium]|jgi:3-hydroxyisobutyrate dehydrogenase